MSDQNTGLVERIEALTHQDNRLDVLCEVALFEPDTCFIACRPNNAGTKVVYQDWAGNDVTCWAQSWTADNRRAATIEAIRDRIKALTA